MFKSFYLTSIFFAITACSEYDLTPIHTVVICDSSGSSPACNQDSLIRILNKNFDTTKKMFEATPGSTFTVFLTSGSTGSTKPVYSSTDFPMAYGRNKHIGDEWVDEITREIQSLNLIVNDTKNNSDIIGAMIVASDFVKNREGKKNIFIISDGRQIGGGVNLEKGQGNADLAAKRLSEHDYEKFDSAQLCGMSYTGISEKNMAIAKDFWDNVSPTIGDGTLKVESSCNNI